MQKGFILILILAVIIGVFVISNSGVVSIDFVFTKVMISQAIVIFVSVLIGAVMATLFGGIRQMSLKKELKQVRAEVKTLQLEKEKIQTEAKMLRLDNETLKSEAYKRDAAVNDVNHSSFLDKLSSNPSRNDPEITDI